MTNHPHTKVAISNLAMFSAMITHNENVNVLGVRSQEALISAKRASSF